jgi:fatty-acyl-CoA synthase
MSGFELLLERAAARRGESSAIHTEAGSVSWHELLRQVERVAGGMASLGISLGDRVAFWLPNGLPYLVLHLACARLGAVTVAVNTRFRERELADIVARSGAVALVLAPAAGGVDYLSVLGTTDARALGRLRHLILAGPGPAGRSRPSPLPAARVVEYAALADAAPWRLPPVPEDAPVALFTTSGTTARPKFALHAQNRAVAHGADVARAFLYGEPGTVVFHALPFCGVFGYSQLLGCLATSADMVLPSAFEPIQAARMMAEHRVTHTSGTDDMLHRLLQAADDLGLGERPFPRLRAIGYAAFNTTLARFHETAARRGLPLRGAFGMSEAYSFFALRRADEPEGRRHAGGGTPVGLHGRVRIVDPDGGDEVPVGEPGALLIRSDNMMLGYDGDPEATKAAFTDDGWFRTGDLARLDGDGGFTFIGRQGDVLRLSGFLVNPLEIEDRLCAYPGIDGAQVVEVATRAGNRPVAFVTLEAGAELDETAAIAHCRDGLAAFKAPVRVVALEAFPTAIGPNGAKIQRAKLREMAKDLAGAG